MIRIAILSIFMLMATSAFADFDRDDHHGPGWGHGPGWNHGPGWGPGVPPPGYGPGYPVPPPPAPYPGYGPGFCPVTCYAQDNFGRVFYAVSPNAYQSQGLAMQYCASAGGYCYATGCR